MSKTFFTADTHFSHQNILKFQDGNLRKFDTVEEMNECIIANWNRVVSANDVVYLLGDVIFGGFSKFHQNMEKTVCKLNGKIRLVAGNHDVYSSGLGEYSPYFDKVVASKEFTIVKGVTGILTHIPIHTSQLDHRFKFNIHGHLHDCCIEDDSRYLCVSQERFNFTPVDIEEIKNIFKRTGIIN